MLFNSIDFAIFFPIVFVLYWAFSGYLRTRNFIILISSYVFYGWWDWRFLFLIAISSLVDYYVGDKVFKTENKKKKKGFLLVSLFVNLGFLFYFKYTNFFIETFADSFKLFGRDLEISTLNIILPVGISFYTFQTLSYTIDIYRGKLEPSKNWLSFFAFVAFFPQLVAGPIERASHLLPQFYKKHKFNYSQVKSGLLLMAFGLFKKMVIADRLAILVNQVYNSPSDHEGIDVIVATVFFAFQIYCDFSGYSDIAIGAARTMGFDLMKNFDSPYLSKSITEFWRRWHISLSTWFRDYVYIPLGGSRNGRYKTYANLFIVFLVSGLWHGAAMTFVVWGGIHGLIIVFEKALLNQRKKATDARVMVTNSVFGKLFSILLTFTIVCFAWIFFRANNFREALEIIKSISATNFSNITNGRLFELGLSRPEFLLSLFVIVSLVLFEWIHGRINIQKMLSSQAIPIRWASYLLIGLIIIVFGIYGNDQVSEFIYFQF